MKFLLLFSILSFATTVQAGPLTELASVKVFSGACKGDPQKWRGSGLLFQYHGESYVATSNHVVLNGNGDYCHSVENTQIKNQSAKLIASDWGMGLALLRLAPSTPLSHLLELSQLAHSTKTAQMVSATAYPYAAMEAVIFSHGEIVSVASDRHFFANAQALIELAGIGGEYGMSGGPVWSAQGELVGLLSHQAIELVAGNASQVMDLATEKDSNRVVNTVFVIPSPVVAAWATRVLATAEFMPSIVESPANQLAHVHSVFTDGLEFKMVEANNESGIGGGHGTGIGGGHGTGIGGGHGTGIGGVHGTGIGGGHGTGIGGGHGTGIGGDEQEQMEQLPSDESNTTLEVTLNTNGKLNGNFLASHGFAEWVNSIKLALNSGRRVIIPIILRNTPNGQVKVSFTSLDEFFRKLSLRNTRPVAHLLPSTHDQALGEVDAPGELNALVESAQKSLTGLSEADLNLSEKVFLKQVSGPLELLNSLDWRTVRQEDLQKLSNPYGANRGVWTSLLTKDRENSIDLLQSLSRMQEALRPYLK